MVESCRIIIIIIIPSVDILPREFEKMVETIKNGVDIIPAGR